jgi:hypothetical protein
MMIFPSSSVKATVAEQQEQEQEQVRQDPPVKTTAIKSYAVLAQSDLITRPQCLIESLLAYVPGLAKKLKKFFEVR